jgi:hypothetical protein
MSSPRKDARWRLATVLAEEAGLDSINELGFETSQLLLSVSDKILGQLSEVKVQELADRWNDNSLAEKRSAKDYAGSALLTVWFEHDFESANPMEGEHEAHWVRVSDVVVNGYEIVPEFKELFIWTARENLFDEDDLLKDSLTAEFSQVISEQDVTEDVAPEETPFAIIVPRSELGIDWFPGRDVREQDGEIG